VRVRWGNYIFQTKINIQRPNNSNNNNDNDQTTATTTTTTTKQQQNDNNDQSTATDNRANVLFTHDYAEQS